jgi:hypothetical protein
MLFPLSPRKRFNILLEFIMGLKGNGILLYFFVSDDVQEELVFSMGGFTHS